MPTCEWGGAHLSTPSLTHQAAAAQDPSLWPKKPVMGSTAPWPQSAWEPVCYGRTRRAEPTESPPLQGLAEDGSWGQRRAQACLPGQGKGPRDPSPAPQIHHWHQKTLSTKMSDCYKCLYKTQSKKRLLLVTAARLASTAHPEDTSHGQISKFTSPRISKAAPSAHPHSPVESSLCPNSVSLSVVLPPVRP